ncbi:MAG: hypothetical protein KBB32_05585 [Spirochaetia bacterium]|nr:hypothetical protein [Spirochaetia bacterium]
MKRSHPPRFPSDDTLWRATWVLNAPGFLALSLATVAIFYQAGFMAWGPAPWLAALKLPVLAGLAVALAAEARASFGGACQRGGTPVGIGDDAADWLSVLASALVGYLASAELGVSNVIVSSLIGISGAILLPQRAVAIYCGSFAGMASPVAFESVGSVLLSGALSATVFVSAKPCFQGVGGRLGAAAYAGSLASSLLLGVPLLGDDIPNPGLAAGMVAYAVIGSVSTYAVSVRLGRGPVMASAFFGLLAGVLLPAIHGTQEGRLFDAAFFAGSFVGMSSLARLRHEGEAGMAGVICGLAYVVAMPWFGGAGGKLGTLAFGSVLAYLGLRSAVRGLLGKSTH